MIHQLMTGVDLFVPASLGTQLLLLSLREKKCAFSLPQGKFQQKDIKSHLLKSGNDLLLWLVHTYVSSLDGRFLDISCLTLVFES